MKQLPIRPPAPAPERVVNPATLGELVAELFGGTARPQRRYRTDPGEAECLLRDIFLGADFIGHGGRYVHLLVTVERPTFTALCQHGAALEDMEDGGDTEPDDDGEPSLAATAMTNQKRWAEGGDTDRELDRSDYEPDSDREPSAGVDVGEPREYPADHPVSGERGKWIMFGKGDAR